MAGGGGWNWWVGLTGKWDCLMGGGWDWWVGLRLVRLTKWLVGGVD